MAAGAVVNDAAVAVISVAAVAVVIFSVVAVEKKMPLKSYCSCS